MARTDTDTDTDTTQRRQPLTARLPGGPRAGQTVGAVVLSLSPVCIELSGADAGTASLFRCLLCVPVLVLLSLPEHRREGPPPRRQLLYGVAGGALF
ncbi:MAG: EamA family transporter, partial [Streptomyces sp.]|nr:EamA family transporter [Streptomyces sp.]NUS25419.1 EamA family transporter [Streptomyces sp.]